MMRYLDVCAGISASTVAWKPLGWEAAARDKGRSGWDDPARCSTDHLKQLLHDHVAKGDPVDVANFCMMLDHYGASTKPVEMRCDLCDDTGTLDHASFGMDPCWRCATPPASDTGERLP